MKVFVTGVNGQLGHDVMLELYKRGQEAIGSGSGCAYRGEDAVGSMKYVQLDITDGEAVSQVLSEFRPDAVIHCSAWTAVDAAEEEENREKVFALNVAGPENLAKACRMIGNAFPPPVAKAVGEQIKEVLTYDAGVVDTRAYRVS